MLKKVLLKTVILLMLFPLKTGSQENIINNPIQPENRYYIKIIISEEKLILYEIKNDSLVLVREYAAATAKKGLDVYPIGKGIITKIELEPFWYPTPNTRNHLAKKGIYVPEKVSPGDPNNFMGAFKIHLSHCTSRGCIYRIHGNNDESQIGKRVTGGCVRMRNKEGVDFAKTIPVGTEVEIIN